MLVERLSRPAGNKPVPGLSVVMTAKLSGCIMKESPGQSCASWRASPKQCTSSLTVFGGKSLWRDGHFAGFSGELVLLNPRSRSRYPQTMDQLTLPECFEWVLVVTLPIRSVANISRPRQEYSSTHLSVVVTQCKTVYYRNKTSAGASADEKRAPRLQYMPSSRMTGCGKLLTLPST